MSLMSYTRKLKPLTFDYSLDQGVLQRPDHVRNLGVTFEAHLTFKEHIHNVLSAAYRSLGLVIRNAKGIQEVDALKALYLALVRSRLEYASHIRCYCRQLGGSSETFPQVFVIRLQRGLSVSGVPPR
jgi:hypothetical protein